MRKVFDLYDKELMRKVLYDSGQIQVPDKLDCVSSEPDPHHNFYFKVEKVWTLAGIKFVVMVPNFSVTSTNLFDAIKDAMLQINSDGPAISRLQAWVIMRRKR